LFGQAGKELEKIAPMAEQCETVVKAFMDFLANSNMK
jgi:hypothetical protein